MFPGRLRVTTSSTAVPATPGNGRRDLREIRPHRGRSSLVAATPAAPPPYRPIGPR